MEKGRDRKMAGERFGRWVGLGRLELGRIGVVDEGVKVRVAAGINMFMALTPHS